MHRTFFAAVFLALLAPAPWGLAEETADFLNQALELVRQAEAPTGSALSEAQRLDLLARAIALAQKAPNHRLKGHRVLAIEAMRGAMEAIRGGDATGQTATYLQTAETELGTSIALAQGSDVAAPPPNPPALSPSASTNDAVAPSWAAHPTAEITPDAAAIFNAARGGDLPKLKALLAGDPTLALSHVACEMTPLLGAAAGGHADAAAALLAMKAAVNARDWIDQTPLHKAAIGGYLDVADLLITHGADVNARDKDGRTPLYEAMFQIPWHKDVAALLLAHGADPNIGDEKGDTPLHEAVAWIRPDKAEFLLGTNVAVNARNKKGDTPLYVAISDGARDDIAQVLLAHGADPTIKGHDGLTPGEVARQKGDTDMAGILDHPAAALGAPPAPVDGVGPADLIARFMGDVATTPPGPVENEVTAEVVQAMAGMAQLTNTKVSPREAIATGFGIFTLEGPVTEFYAQGLAAIYEGKATLTEAAAKEFQDDYDQSGATVTVNGKEVTDKGPSLVFGPGSVDFTDAKVPADRQVVVSFCLVQQQGRWKVHCLYFSSAPLAGDHRDFVVRQLAAFSRK